MKEHMLKIEEMAEKFNCSKQSIRRWHRAGIIPAPIRCGRRAIRWRESDVVKFLNQQSSNSKSEETGEVLI